MIQFGSVEEILHVSSSKHIQDHGFDPADVKVKICGEQGAKVDDDQPLGSRSSQEKDNDEVIVMVHQERKSGEQEVDEQEPGETCFQLQDLNNKLEGSLDSTPGISVDNQDQPFCEREEENSRRDQGPNPQVLGNKKNKKHDDWEQRASADEQQDYEDEDQLLIDNGEQELDNGSTTDQYQDLSKK